jgi:hypothetical protein
MACKFVTVATYYEDNILQVIPVTNILNTHNYRSNQ